MELLAPDGYYHYLQIDKPPSRKAAASNTASSTSETAPLHAVDEDAVKKAYRKLSRKHHPDKLGGDADTFRLLNRAHKVLTTPKLREQYDILGIDLDDDENVVENNDDDDDDKPSGSNNKTAGGAQGIVHEIANMILTGIVQLGVRTRESYFAECSGRLCLRLG